jgi:AraC-like DNA-binding protein
MEHFIQELELLHNICHYPMVLISGNGEILRAWPNLPEGVFPFAYHAVIEDFRLQKRDQAHPLINFLGTGFLLGVMELSRDAYVLIGLAPSHAQTRKNLLAMLKDVVHPHHLQSVCDFLLQMPLMTLHQLREYMRLLSKLLLKQDIPADNILFMDILAVELAEPSALEKNLFAQREDPEFHIPVDFETSICNAIELGNRALLERCLHSPTSGRVGRMSSNELRQQKYSFICMATLASRAAIRGGLPSENAFSLSDLYCQRVDLLSEISHIENLTYTMLVDYCDRVSEVRAQPAVSQVIQRCLSYISVHLHTPITLEQLASHCGLCGRSLSLRFRKEVGICIPDYIHREKMKEAEYLLLNSDCSISEITAFLNYPSHSYFTQIFKKFYSVTPQVYRARQVNPNRKTQNPMSL